MQKKPQKPETVNSFDLNTPFPVTPALMSLISSQQHLLKESCLYSSFPYLSRFTPIRLLSSTPHKNCSSGSKASISPNPMVPSLTSKQNLTQITALSPLNTSLLASRTSYFPVFFLFHWLILSHLSWLLLHLARASLGTSFLYLYPPFFG